MSFPNAPVLILIMILLLWISLGIWRRSGARLMEKMELSYRAYHARTAGESERAPDPVRWDFDQEMLVSIPSEEVQEIDGRGGLKALAVRAPEKRLPLFAYGVVLARIPALWFHGMFAAASIVLAFVIIFRIRVG